MPSFLIFLWILCGAILLLIAWLRWTKAKIPLSLKASQKLTGVPSPKGIIYRLDGMNHKNRPLLNARILSVKADGTLSLPLHQWEKGEMTVARFASVSYLWALAQMAEQDPEGHKQRETHLARARLIPLLALFFLLLFLLLGKIAFPLAFSLWLFIWTLCVVTSLPSQFREWKVIALAKDQLKKSGLYPADQTLVVEINRCLSAQAWARVAGMTQIITR